MKNQNNTTPNYFSYDEARKFMSNLGLKTPTEFWEWSKSAERPAQVPSNPYRWYRNRGFLGWAHFLGKKFKNGNRIKFLSYKKASAYMQKHFPDINTEDKFMKWRNSGERPVNIPASPKLAYNSIGWISWDDFLCSEKHLPYEQIKDILRSKKIKRKAEYLKLAKRNKSIPQYPDRIYQDRWVNWQDFLTHVSINGNKEENKTNKTESKKSIPINMAALSSDDIYQISEESLNARIDNWHRRWMPVIKRDIKRLNRILAKS